MPGSGGEDAHDLWAVVFEASRLDEVVELVVRSLFDHYCAHPEEIPNSIPPGSIDRRVTDWIAGMTDRFCIRAFEALSIPVAFAP